MYSFVIVLGPNKLGDLLGGRAGFQVGMQKSMENVILLGNFLWWRGKYNWNRGSQTLSNGGYTLFNPSEHNLTKNLREER